ncbi:hypothetical protein [Streptomyces albiaxialis]|uniref:hypothetical protein n=1 Tax=Streptomyces albiaxialis TaxID=329523 RepID=UPI0031CE5F17
MAGRAVPRAPYGARPLAIVGLVLVLAGCTSGGGEDEGVEARELCHGVLSPGAVRAVRVLGAEDGRYRESRDVPLAQAARTLRGNADAATSRTVVCRVSAAEDGKGDDPLLQVEFTHLGAGDEPRRAREPGQVRYGVGEVAWARDSGAFLAFRCAGGLRRGDPPMVAGSVHVPFTDRHAKLSGAARARAAMTVLHSVSRAMAARLDCRKESRIPAKPPRPLTTSDAR